LGSTSAKGHQSTQMCTEVCSTYVCKTVGPGCAELLNCFKVPSLGDHRKYLSLRTMYKVVNEMVYFPMMCLCLGLPH